MDVCPALVADGQAAVLGQPCQRTLHDSAMPSQPIVALDPLAGNVAPDATTMQVLPAPRDVIPFVSMQFLRPFPPSAA
jgi:hypothetical protein